jgi:hypothetical protein
MLRSGKFLILKTRLRLQEKQSARYLGGLMGSKNNSQRKRSAQEKIKNNSQKLDVFDLISAHSLKRPPITDLIRFDQTQLDVGLKEANCGLAFGRARTVVLIDAFSRSVLGIALQPDER